MSCEVRRMRQRYGRKCQYPWDAWDTHTISSRLSYVHLNNIHIRFRRPEAVRLGAFLYE